MSVEGRLDAIRPQIIRKIAKGIYFALTFQFLERLRERGRVQRSRDWLGELEKIALPYQIGAGSVRTRGGANSAGHAWLEVVPVRSRSEYELEVARPQWQARARIERQIAHGHLADKEFGLSGFSIFAGRAVNFHVDHLYGAEMLDGLTIPRWRERLVCPVTHLTNRQRAMMLFLKEYGGRVFLRDEHLPDVFMFEQLTTLFQYVRATEKQWNLTGCEWLGTEVKPGAVVNGIRHEDCAALSLPDNSVDIVMSLDVFEHVPDPRQGFREKARVLRPGGVLLMTVPFFPDRDTTVQRARQAGGKLEHLLPPEYHGNPVDPDGGSLVYHDFGWDLLPMIRASGFSDAYLGLYWSMEFGHLGAPQMVFIATK